MPHTPFKIKKIRTADDYERALIRIDSLMDAEAGSERFDELEVLTTLVETYEEVNFPIDLPSPLTAIAFRMEQGNLKPRDLIPILGSRTAVSEVLSGKKPLTLPMVRGLHEKLSIPLEALIKAPNKVMSKDSLDLSKFPLKLMAKMGWLAQATEKCLKQMIDKLGENELQPMYRKNDTSRSNAKTDAYALQAWCFQALKEASSKRFKKPYEKGCVDQNFLENIAKLSVHENGPLLAQSELAKHGIALVTVPHLSRTHLDGAAFWFKDRPVIGMTLRYDRIDNFWFCLLHELAHIGRHLESEPIEAFFVDDHSLRGSGTDTKEKEADDWAEKALIPPVHWAASAAKTDPSPETVLALAVSINRHPAIIAGRIRFESKNYHLLSQFVGSGAIRKQFWGADKKTAA